MRGGGLWFPVRRYALLMLRATYLARNLWAEIGGRHRLTNSHPLQLQLHPTDITAWTGRA